MDATGAIRAGRPDSTGSDAECDTGSRGAGGSVYFLVPNARPIASAMAPPASMLASSTSVAAAFTSAGAWPIAKERPARDIHQIVEAIVEQLTTLPGSRVKLRLEIEADVPGGLERTKVRTLVENANTLGFIEKSVE